MSGPALREIAAAVRRLRFKVENPAPFYEERRRLAEALEEAARNTTCTACPVSRLNFQLDEKRRQIAWERRRREEAEARADQPKALWRPLSVP